MDRDKINEMQGKATRRRDGVFSIGSYTYYVTGREPRKYWSDLKQKLISEGYTEVSDTIGQMNS